MINAAPKTIAPPATSAGKRLNFDISNLPAADLELVAAAAAEPAEPEEDDREAVILALAPEEPDPDVVAAAAKVPDPIMGWKTDPEEAAVMRVWVLLLEVSM